jgi:hypothetical protein
MSVKISGVFCATNLIKHVKTEIVNKLLAYDNPSVIATL